MTYEERLSYERRILAAECGTQRILNELETKLRWFADQARTNRDAMDAKAAEILTNIADMVHEIDVTAKEPLIDITKAMRVIRNAPAKLEGK